MLECIQFEQDALYVQTDPLTGNSLHPESAALTMAAPVNSQFQSGGIVKASTGIAPGGHTGATIADRSSVFFTGGGVGAANIFHEALHSATGLGDERLAAQLGLGSPANASQAIQQALKDHGCVK